MAEYSRFLQLAEVSPAAARAYASTRGYAVYLVNPHPTGPIYQWAHAQSRSQRSYKSEDDAWCDAAREAALTEDRRDGVLRQILRIATEAYALTDDPTSAEAALASIVGLVRTLLKPDLALELESVPKTVPATPRTGNPRIWAREFVLLAVGSVNQHDQSWMEVWFAEAIQMGFDEAVARSTGKYADAVNRALHGLDDPRDSNDGGSSAQ